MSVAVPGVCSVTFRSRSVEAVAGLAAQAGLTAIEWGGDVHVPPGDAAAAARVVAACAADGIAVCGYGSYLGAGGPPSHDEIARVIDTTVAIGARSLRVWAQFGVEPGAADATVAPVVDGLRAVASAAAVHGIVVGIEFHGGTLTATPASARALLAAVGAPNLGVGWQPPYWDPDHHGDAGAQLDELARSLVHVHVYEWEPDTTRRPLASGTPRWAAVCTTLRALAADDRMMTLPMPRCAFLEFVADDDPEQFARDAATLRALVEARA